MSYGRADPLHRAVAEGRNVRKLPTVNEKGVLTSGFRDVLIQNHILTGSTTQTLGQARRTDSARVGRNDPKPLSNLT